MIYGEGGNTTFHSSQEPDAEIVYDYDALDRLISIKEGSRITRYTYNAFNCRSKQTGEKTNYLYLQNNEVVSVSSTKTEFRVLGQGLSAEIDASVLKVKII